MAAASQSWPSRAAMAGMQSRAHAACRRLPAAPAPPSCVLLAVPRAPRAGARALAASGCAGRRGAARPRLVWGPEPILSYAHWSRALRKAGYESETVMHSVYTSSTGRTTSTCSTTTSSAPAWSFLFGPYVAFVRSLFRADVFQHHYSGGFLSPRRCGASRPSCCTSRARAS